MESCFLILNDLKQGHREAKCFAQYPAVYQQKYWAWKPPGFHISCLPPLWDRELRGKESQFKP